MCGAKYNWGRVCCRLLSVAVEATFWLVWSPIRCDLYLLRQLELREAVREPYVQWQVKAHRDQVSLYQGYGAKRSSEAPLCCDGRADHWCTDQIISLSKVWVLQGEAWCPLDRGPLQRKLMCLLAFLTWWKAKIHMVICKCRDALMWLSVVLPHDQCRAILMWLRDMFPHDQI